MGSRLGFAVQLHREREFRTSSGDRACAHLCLLRENPMHLGFGAHLGNFANFGNYGIFELNGQFDLLRPTAREYPCERAASSMRLLAPQVSLRQPGGGTHM